MGLARPSPDWVRTESRTLVTNIAYAFLAAGIGAGIAVIGGGFGIGKLVAAAMEGTARQPSASGDIRTTMIIGAALIEGATFFGLLVCLLLSLKS